MEELQFKVTGVETESPVANSFWRFSPSRPRLLAKRLRPWRQNSLSNSLPTGVRSFGGADFCSGKEQPAANIDVLARNVKQHERKSACQNRLRFKSCHLRQCMYFDTHCHPTGFGGEQQLLQFIKSCKQQRIGIFFMSTDISSFEYLDSLAQQAPHILPCFGIHPQNAHQYEKKLNELEAYIKRCRMVGEIGLDAQWSPKETRYAQADVFLAQLSWAKKYQKPISIHTTGCEEQCYELIKQVNGKNVCIHWYHGSLDLLKKYIDLGCYFTIGPDIGTTSHANDIAKLIPANRLLCETDGPDAVAWAKKEALGPKHTSPHAIIGVYEALAHVRKMDQEELKAQIWHNAMEFSGCV